MESQEFFVSTPEGGNGEPLFHLATVKRGGRLMYGIIASQKIPRGTWLCSYPGDLTPRNERVKYLKSLAKQERTRQAAYDMVWPFDEDLLLVPVDTQGEIKDKYLSEPGPRFNEASEVGEYPNAQFKEGFFGDESMDIVTIKTIQKGEEILVDYGTEYARSWKVWWRDQATGKPSSTKRSRATQTDEEPPARSVKKERTIEDRDATEKTQKKVFIDLTLDED
jgi:hypothetical protein